MSAYGFGIARSQIAGPRTTISFLLTSTYKKDKSPGNFYYQNDILSLIALISLQFVSTHSFIMPLGILESRSNGNTFGHHVPGTVLLDTHTNTTEQELLGLKKGTGKNKEVILVPQPSNDPNDPLNWPLWQRDCILLVYCYGTVCVIGGWVSYSFCESKQLTILQCRSSPLVNGPSDYYGIRDYVY